MLFCSCGARVEILGDPLGREIWATFEVPATDSLEKCENALATEGLVGKVDAIGFVPHGMCEESNLCGGMGMGFGNDRGLRRE
jgi:hypothetical protein